MCSSQSPVTSHQSPEREKILEKGEGRRETIWGLLDDKPGHANQVRGLVAALGEEARLIPLSYNILSPLPNLLLGATRAHLSGGGRHALTAPWPDMVIASGRRTEPVARWIKKQNPATKIVYLMTPASLSGWDALVIPAHDRPVQDARVIKTLGPLYPVTDATLAAARTQWEAAFSPYASPRIGILFGNVTPEEAQAMLAAAIRLAGRSGSFLISNSRRTERAILPALPIDRARYLYDWHDARGDNPYMGILASADALIVSGDSLSMCAEACATGTPVYIASAEGLPPKHRAMHEALFAGGYARPLAQAGSGKWTQAAPLREAVRIAEVLRTRLA